MSRHGRRHGHRFSTTTTPGSPWAILSATLNLRLSSNSVFMGCGSVDYADHPLYIAVHGYIANSAVTASDFRAGCTSPLNCNNYLDRYFLPLPPNPLPEAGTVISFNGNDALDAGDVPGMVAALLP